MIRNIFFALLIVAVFVVGYIVWTRTHSGNNFGDGAITEQASTPSSDQSGMNSGSTTDLDGNAAHPTPSRSDDPGTINTVPVGSTGSQSSASQGSNPQTSTATPSTGTTMGTPMADNTPAPAPSPLSAPGGLVERHPVLGPGTPPPTGDSLSSIPPNHVGFGGTGKYMWYREGDITWRVNSNTGDICIALATMEQWAKPIVYRRGCDSHRG